MSKIDASRELQVSSSILALLGTDTEGWCGQTQESRSSYSKPLRITSLRPVSICTSVLSELPPVDFRIHLSTANATYSRIKSNRSIFYNLELE